MAAEGLRAQLHARGQRLTTQRQLVLTHLTRLGHATAEEIAHAAEADGAPLHLSSVYRALEVLESLGLAGHAHLGGASATYHPAGTAHPHLLCRTCGRREDLEPAVLVPLAEQLQTERGFDVDVGHLTLLGTCAACRASASGPATSGPART
ncbi:MAG: transcriptional repressor [Actinomycetota bacterium]|nr:transcriptional repressor [Actinomycetota bacterium]